MSRLLQLLFLLFTAACANSNHKLEIKLNQQLQPVRSLTHGYRVLNLDSLADFDWDNVYLFSSGDSTPIPSEAISQALGFKWHGPELGYQQHRLIFVKLGEVADFADFADGDFVEFDGLDQKTSPGLPLDFLTCGAGGVMRRYARFAAVHTCSRGYDKIYLIPLHCLGSYRHIVDDTGCSDWPVQVARRQAIQDSSDQAKVSVHQ